MATKTYPLWRPGSPQLRIFLPNFFMKLIKSDERLPPNVVKFHVHIRMSDIDVKNYLTKIYNVPVKDVRTNVHRSPTIRHPMGGEMREPSKRIAFVTLEKDVKFAFPNLFPETSRKELEREEADFDDSMQKMKQQREKHWDRAGAPTWFSI